jgi:GNAT superfamily N-acetyltransferase
MGVDTAAIDGAPMSQGARNTNPFPLKPCPTQLEYSYPNRNCSQTMAVAQVNEAEFPRDIEKVTALFTAYAKSLEIDLSFQKFDEELSSLPGKYSAMSKGVIFLAYNADTFIDSFLRQATGEKQGQVLGCAALRAFNTPNSCELKRLYTIPEARGQGTGRRLLEAVIQKAKDLGYTEMLLDTLSSMTAARKMYADYGFEECEKYYDTTIEGTAFMRLKLL